MTAHFVLPAWGFVVVAVVVWVVLLVMVFVCLFFWIRAVVLALLNPTQDLKNYALHGGSAESFDEERRCFSARLLSLSLLLSAVLN